MRFLPFLRRSTDGRPRAAAFPAPAQDALSVAALRVRTRRRLIGVAVLVTLAVLLLPWLLESPPRAPAVPITLQMPGGEGSAAIELAMSPAPRAPEQAASSGSRGVAAALAAGGGAAALAEATVASRPLVTGPAVAPGGTRRDAAPPAGERATAQDPAGAPAPTRTAPSARSSADLQAARDLEAAQKRRDAQARRDARERQEAQARRDAEQRRQERERSEAQVRREAQAQREGSTRAETKRAAQARPEAPPRKASPERPAATAAAAADKPRRVFVQVGAYAEAATVKSVRRRIERLGMASQEQIVETAAGRRTRVRLGPFASREEAERAAARLRAGGLGGTVVAP